jgi:hypothetical protein
MGMNKPRRPLRPLTPAQLATVTGGTTHEIVSPRDPATGVATGKRQH